VSHATHANAALTPRARLRLARLVVDEDWSIPRAAERYDVSWRTAKKWADRYRCEGPAGMVDRSSRPHRQPNRTPTPVVHKIVHLRWKQRLGRSRSATGSAWRPRPCTRWATSLTTVPEPARPTRNPSATNCA